MRLVAVGRMKDKAELALVDRYLKRLRPRLEIVELADGRGSPDEIKRREAQAILAACPQQAFLIVLDEAGQTLTSPAFSAAIADWSALGRPLCFVIGGAEGLDASIIERADAKLSFGTLTWPHMLVRIMLSEQIYRAQAIAAGHPYHRSGRP
ncbi:23S rRNA (pseudouridine(1915)-N(3))-methyltransferase RlmH [Acetobacter indonesiensis]|uniref:Ribosomal RNA large subunit methyltransferase H n=1 Tax=Acetobacter indonesiensis TaxID=104101 RepID=A0A252ANZ9_9PROT|nr:23S rRNA (pseudouridine(1915)-N(3))-methyltransferase RlmH [Acetobacter indonesiensis]MCG0995616.1 23S rRNA (pseudouridine(1915)-N(3))-methyltransferase RlmH [Acetobacter indonesiensis]MCI1438742.1 23S rRNA (pseudouridine(1915)-N(3))-methyltransferase RlmH [Acetobacter indonesiensis]MCI1546359.1 23S rRNA (pseudouridine(1915)-N(3))-methyltransferase RlmH [Acetobacter indonesiensis]MCI1765864.1 23S rRNA (pseudouridine(1915)-N(3))-methyltransferase RlmH [Acetobacter indonesiensis]OUI91536.1 50